MKVRNNEFRFIFLQLFQHICVPIDFYHSISRVTSSELSFCVCFTWGTKGHIEHGDAVIPYSCSLVLENSIIEIELLFFSFVLN